MFNRFFSRKMNSFLVWQQVVSERFQLGTDTKINVEVIIRVVDAVTKEEAIGKFVERTSTYQFIQKLDIQACVLTDIERL
ncbi:hypothetical protein [Fibrella aquatilis]|uniref:Uncharacterized protein n=1 Tax=Fibrella aquatilis TaxID=2817059 RepID=A0A939GC82_9BACT|nr:hypothetical protein [Fibrella aquatilis]MBO0933932.1 hypothetical protein [Fibrella aquatilis]